MKKLPIALFVLVAMAAAASSIVLATAAAPQPHQLPQSQPQALPLPPATIPYALMQPGETLAVCRSRNGCIAMSFESYRDWVAELAKRAVQGYCPAQPQGTVL